MFDINGDSFIDIKDLKNYFTLLLRDSKEVEKIKIIDNLAKTILNEFKANDLHYMIDKNNFQKILWSSSFAVNLIIDP